MGLIRVIVFGLAIWLLYKFYNAYKARMRSLDSAEKQGGSMVKCSECGCYTPKANAIISGAQFFCCKAHQADFEAKRDDEQR